MSLRKRTVSGVLWTFTQQVSVQLINFVISVILARILLPAEFGLIGMLSVFMAIGISLTDSGMTSSLIRKNDADQKDYSTVFFINLIFSIIVYCIVFLCGPLIADFFRQPILSPLVRLYAVSFIIRAFVGVQTTRLTKQMKFKVQMMMQIPSVIIGGVVGIILANMGYGVWSLVWMNLIQTTLFTIQHWIFSGWRPDWIIDRATLGFHLKYGYKLTISGLLDTIYKNAYNIIIGKFFAASQLGYYTRAKSIQMLPVVNIGAALDKVTFPMFASIKDDDVKLKSAYRKLMHQVIFWIAPVMVLLALIAQPLFVLLFTAKWLPAVPYFQILCFAGILYPIHSYNLNILKVKGRTDLFLRLEIIKKIFITIGIAVSVFWGIYALLIFQILSSIFALWINSWYSGKMINYSGGQQIKDIFPTIFIALVIGAAIWAVGEFNSMFSINTMNDWLAISIIPVVYMIIYLLINILIRSAALAEFRKTILKR